MSENTNPNPSQTPAVQLQPPAKKKKSHWKRNLIILVVVLAIASGGFFLWQNNQASSQKSAPRPVFTVSNQDLSTSLSVSGQIQTAYMTEVNTKAEGIIDHVYVKNGDQVKKGDVLFSLALSPESQQQSQSAYNSLLNAQDNLKSAQAQLHANQSTLFNKNKYFIEHAVEEDLDPSDPDYIMQNADWLNAEATYLNQEQKIKTSQQAVTVASLNYKQYSSTITAPADGEVMGISATEGMSVKNSDDNSQRLAVIKAGNTMVVKVDVNEIDIGKIKVGQKAEVSITAVKNKTFEGEVISIDQVGNSGSSSVTYPVLVSFTADDQYAVLPNMSADVEIYTTTLNDVLAVSTLAVQEKNGKYFVDVITSENRDSKTGQLPTESREVTIGEQTSDYTQILSGLNAGDKVQMGNFITTTTSGQVGGMMMMGGAGGMGGGNVMRSGNGGGRPQNGG